MSDKIDQFCENLGAKLHAVESHLTKVGESVKAAPKQAAEAVRSSIDKAKAQHEHNMQKISDCKAKFDDRMHAKKEEVEAHIEEWKTNRETHKLEKRADNAEEYAIAAVEYAAACVVEADLASLEAVAARMDAEEAKAVAT